jgi:subfamily B ATP-binding cassette protein MsbA
VTMATLDRLRTLRDLRTLGVAHADLVRLLGLTALLAIFEGVGVGLLLPALELAQDVGRGPVSGAGRAASDWLALPASADPRRAMAALLLGAFGTLALRSALKYFRDRGAATLKQSILSRLRRRAVAAFVHANAAFLARHSSGELFAGVTVEAERGAEALATRVAFLNSATICLVYLGLLVVLSPVLALFTTPIAAVVGLAFWWQQARTAPRSLDVSAANTRLSEQVGDYLGGIERVKMRTLEERAVQAVGDVVDRAASSLLRIEQLRITTDVVVHPLVVLGALSVIYVAAGQLRMSLAGLGMFMFVLARVGPQVVHMHAVWALMHGCMASFRRVERLTEEALAEREVQTGHRAFEQLASGIRFDRVSFRYSGAAPTSLAIENLSCDIARGELTAIVGRSGSGKTTLVRLLTGFYRAGAGRILIDGAPIEDYDRRSLRRRIALVPQEPFLFNTTIRDNIGFGAEGSDLTPLATLLGLSHCSEFVGRLEHGVDTAVGERGNHLSHGQRQRVAIAHALAVRPEILILDEPTSALDAESEQAIQEMMARLRGETTIVVIAHRLSTILHADTILLLDGGRVRAAGPHACLMRDSELYRRLFALQALG